MKCRKLTRPIDFLGIYEPGAAKEIFKEYIPPPTNIVNLDTDAKLRRDKIIAVY